jgi:ABC-2 type transport system permease protein
VKRVLIIAQAEFLALVRTKFFIIGILVMPVLIGGLFAFLGYADKQTDRTERHFAVLDGTGALYATLLKAAEEYNGESGEGSTQTGPHFLPENVDPAGRSAEDLRLEQSARVRRKEIFAFVEIPKSVLDPGAKEPVRYYSESTSYTRLSRWLDSTLNAEIEQRRFSTAGVDPSVVKRLTTDVDLDTFGLVERRADGTMTTAKQVDEIQRFGIPFFFLILMFMAVMSNAQHLINTIIEEKMSKISEVLLGSVSAFQLLMGKLVGIVAVSFLLSFVYLGGGIYALLQFGRPDLINVSLIGWFLVFVVCASLMFGSLFQALSSACSDLKDAQSMLQPAMMLVIVAYLASFLVMRSPDSTMAVVLSFIPTVTPFAMMQRLAMPPGPPLWQVLLSVVLLIGVTIVVVWAAGRIFRVGLLMQGKPPNLPELMRWIRR